MMGRAGPAAAGFALLLVAGALVLMLVALQIHVREVDMLWGPRLFPVAVMATLLIAGACVIVTELSPRVRAESAEEPNDWLAMAYVLGGLALFGAIVETGGFVIAATVLFVSVSRGFGSRRLPIDASIGLVLATAIYTLFVQGLGLYLPAGALFSILVGR
jgi:putative tricarboxylic transport membrane protein